MTLDKTKAFTENLTNWLNGSAITLGIAIGKYIYDKIVYKLLYFIYIKGHQTGLFDVML